MVLNWNNVATAEEYKWKALDSYICEINDDAENGNVNWIFSGFSIKTTYHHSGSHSFYSGSGDNLNNYMKSSSRFTISSNAVITFWVYYNIEDGYDFAYFEVSEDGISWDTLGTYTGENTTWTKLKYSLSEYSGKQIYIRFKYVTDEYYSGVLVGWFYVDDIKIETEGNVITTGTTNSTSADVTLYNSWEILL